MVTGQPALPTCGRYGRPRPSVARWRGAPARGRRRPRPTDVPQPPVRPSRPPNRAPLDRRGLLQIRSAAGGGSGRRAPLGSPRRAAGRPAFPEREQEIGNRFTGNRFTGNRFTGNRFIQEIDLYGFQEDLEMFAASEATGTACPDCPIDRLGRRVRGAGGAVGDTHLGSGRPAGLVPPPPPSGNGPLPHAANRARAGPGRARFRPGPGPHRARKPVFLGAIRPLRRLERRRSMTAFVMRIRSSSSSGVSRPGSRDGGSRA